MLTDRGESLVGISGGCKVYEEDFSSSIDPDAAEAFLPYKEGIVKGPSSLALFFYSFIHSKCIWF